MNKNFLYRLFKEARFFFLFAVLFILGYSVALYKQMDMLVFPLNNMFSKSNARDFTTTTYAVKLNGKIIHITDDKYLKKDFSENSLQMFCKWIKADGKDIITGVVEKRIKDSVQRIFLLKNLKPPKNTLQTWPGWFIKFHGFPITEGDEITIWEYRFSLQKDHFILRDSSLVIKQSVAKE